MYPRKYFNRKLLLHAQLVSLTKLDLTAGIHVPTVFLKSVIPSVGPAQRDVKVADMDLSAERVSFNFLSAHAVCVNLL